MTPSTHHPLVRAGSPPPVADTVDLADVARTVRRQWRALLACVAVGMALALVVVLFAPRRYQASSTVLVRQGNDASSSLLSRLGGAGAIGGLLTGGSSSPLETELQLLQSRGLLGEVVDTLRQQVVVRSPAGAPARAFVRAVDAPGTFRAQRFTFTRSAGASAYTVTGAGGSVTVAPGGSVQLPVGRVSLADSLPAEFELQVLDREDAITRLAKSLSVGKAGGEVVRVSYRAPDSVTAAEVTNAVIASYLTRRRTTDRGTNQHRVEFIEAQLDTIRPQLAAVEQALMRHQEATRNFDAKESGKLQLEQAIELRQQLGALTVEERALSQLLSQVQAGTATPRQLTAYPTFLKSGGINQLLTQLSELETERSKLLERRLETDPEVVALTRGIRDIEGQLVPLASAYGASLRQQRSDMSRQLDTLQTALLALPAVAMSSGRMQREVLRLSQTYAALQAQLVEARLAAIGEGGGVRQLDVATPPKKVVFPAPVLTMGVGLGSGLLFGLLAAVIIGTMGRYVNDPRLIERVAGVPALPFQPGGAFLVGNRPAATTVLLVPLTTGVSTAGIAQRMAQTALARAIPATVLDLTGDTLPADGVNAAIARLEAEQGTVIVQLPELTHDTAAAALRETRTVYLVADEGRVDRSRLVDAVDTLRRLEVPCAGVVVNGAVSPTRRRGRLPV